ncbi:MAG TPA: RNA 2',3'-cyclic phosphodiesterase [Gaiellaceae bacterium]|nr:RNA 2',3'-cyclic phosphodiesterase [Gaiellaceae bacterium]
MSSAARVGERERLRLFVAFRLPEDVLERLVSWQRGVLRPPQGVRLVPEENLHATIAFLGHRPAEELDAIAGAAREAARTGEPPVLTPTRYRETRSVGMVIFDDEDERATRIAEEVHGRLERLGVYEREKRRWLPHVTVARFRKPPRLRPPAPELGRVSPSEVAVYISRLRPGGAQYEVLESVALGGR